jgi:hypothetical protein
MVTPYAYMHYALTQPMLYECGLKLSDDAHLSALAK